jgi:HPt (histidine-containing phosphotransfer) domain-containing protein
LIIVFKNINRIKAALPEVIHIVMFYNNGTIFQTTFDKDVNIPKLGENLAELIHHIKVIYEISQFKIEDYKKMIFETSDISVIILKLGEDSNIALFFKKDLDKDLKLSSIKRYITRIETLIDMSEEQIILEEILTKENELGNIQKHFQLNQEKIHSIHDKLKNLDVIEHSEESTQLEKELRSLNEESTKLEKEIQKIQEEIIHLRQNIEE